MKVDFNQIKTTISLPDFLLELGWKIRSPSAAPPAIKAAAFRLPGPSASESRPL